MTSKSPWDNLHFDRPPIIEVVCGLMFEPLKELLAPHLGLLWERFKPAYAMCKEAPPLAIQIETEAGTVSEAEFLEVPPLPRIMFEEPQGNGVLQIQRDRFHHNWRRQSLEDVYPHFEEVFSLFQMRLDTFRAFLAEAGLGKMAIKQYEITYVNHIPRGDGWETTADIGNVFPDFSWRRDDKRSEPSSINWRASFKLPSGRLHTTIRNATRISDSKEIILFDLTARGIGEDRTDEDMEQWFRNSHDEIVKAFAEMTSPELQTATWRVRA